jgi:hypothetical protein
MSNVDLPIVLSLLGALVLAAIVADAAAGSISQRLNKKRLQAPTRRKK